LNVTKRTLENSKNLHESFVVETLQVIEPIPTNRLTFEIIVFSLCYFKDTKENIKATSTPCHESFNYECTLLPFLIKVCKTFRVLISF
jgi:hypothetical protein